MVQQLYGLDNKSQTHMQCALITLQQFELSHLRVAIESNFCFYVNNALDNRENPQFLRVPTTVFNARFSVAQINWIVVSLHFRH